MQWPSVIEAPVQEHSRKPDKARRMIEAMFPNLPRIELFARSRCKGWDAWGQEADRSDEPSEPVSRREAEKVDDPI
jgi:N6-adenosine-specific RNA methylase IME4